MPHIIEPDRFALLTALVVQLISGGDCSSLIATGVFPDLVERVFKKSESVLKRRFDSNGAKFFNIMLIRVSLAIVEEDNNMLAIEQWLDAELREASIDPREFNKRK